MKKAPRFGGAFCFGLSGFFQRAPIVLFARRESSGISPG
jgi:hypothetical protein